MHLLQRARRALSRLAALPVVPVPDARHGDEAEAMNEGNHDIVQQVCCTHAPHPAPCSACGLRVAAGDRGHQHHQLVRASGFKMLTFHAVCAEIVREVSGETC